MWHIFGAVRVTKSTIKNLMLRGFFMDGHIIVDNFVRESPKNFEQLATLSKTRIVANNPEI